MKISDVYEKAPFLKEFKNQVERRKYIMHWRWPDGFICPHCDAEQEYYRSKRKRKSKGGKKNTRYYYQCKECKRESSLFKGTVFESTKVPLKTWFLGYGIIKHYEECSIKEFQKILGIKTYKTALNLYHDIKDRPEFKSLFSKETLKRWKEKNEE